MNFKVAIFDSIHCKLRNVNETTFIEGHAAVYEKASMDLGLGFLEMVQRGAFDKVLSARNSDVVGLLNHDKNMVLGRMSNRTLQLEADDTGLYYRINPPDTTYARDLITLMERQDVMQSSFSFLDKFTWKRDGSNLWRIITEVTLLRDVGPVTIPFYPDTTSRKRSLDEYLQEERNSAHSEAQRKRIIFEQKAIINSF